MILDYIKTIFTEEESTFFIDRLVNIKGVMGC